MQYADWRTTGSELSETCTNEPGNQRNVGMHGGHIPTLDASSDRMGDSAVNKKLAVDGSETFSNERDVRHTSPPNLVSGINTEVRTAGTTARRSESVTTLIVLTP